jgi:hypothetical protein
MGDGSFDTPQDFRWFVRAGSQQMYMIGHHGISKEQKPAGLPRFINGPARHPFDRLGSEHRQTIFRYSRDVKAEAGRAPRLG